MSERAATVGWTVDDFLAWEGEQEARYEWDGASVVAMTGATLGHNAVVGNIARVLFDQRPADCRTFSETVKLRIGDVIRYPDVVLACSETFDLSDDVLDDAMVIIEVLSPSTARVDRVAKLAEYARVPSLESYLLVDPERRHVELYRREAEQLVPAAANDGTVVMLAPNVELRIDDIYAEVL